MVPSVILNAVSNANAVEAALAVLSAAKELRPRRGPSLRQGGRSGRLRTDSRACVNPLADFAYAKRSLASERNLRDTTLDQVWRFEFLGHGLA